MPHLPILRPRLFALLLALPLCLAGVAENAVAQRETAPAAKVDDSELGSTPNCFRVGNIWLCGQPTEKDFLLARKRGVDRVITLRTSGELSWDEENVVTRAGMKYVEAPFRGPSEMTDEVIDRVREILKEADRSGESVMLHCAGAVRVGAVWLAYRVLDQGQDLQEAVEEARKVGMRGGYETRALQYIQAQQGK